ncbi:MAG: DUF5110 domain-containing protein, partial [Chitinophagales bacterium]
IIPMRSAAQSFDDRNMDTLFIHLYVGRKENEFIYYEDDGETFDYTDGNYYSRKLIYQPSAKEFILEKPEGNFASKVKTIKLIFHGYSYTHAVITVNSVPAVINIEKISMLFPEEAGKILYYATSDKCDVRTITFSNNNERISVHY